MLKNVSFFGPKTFAGHVTFIMVRIRMAVASLVTALVLIAGASAAGSRRTSSAKWAQTRKTLLITVPLRRDKVNCGSEAAEMKSPTQLSFSTECENGESFHLDLELQHKLFLPAPRRFKGL